MVCDLDLMVRARVRGEGIVQGVGFRPFVYSLATEYGLAGWVLNDGDGVLLEVEGPREQVERFVDSLADSCPPVARVENLMTEFLEPSGFSRFEIRQSRETERRSVLVSPDLAVCPLCLGELLNPTDRRFQYPFINCTNCGPRYTIILDLPYDRSATTMSAFTMCDDCHREYESPTDRRFHAQPNACAECGPSVSLLDCEGKRLSCDDPIAGAAELLNDGKILAVKGLGGYHIACDATNQQVVAELRKRKSRSSKPFAIMCPDLATIRSICTVSGQEEELLCSAKAPIVLLQQRSDSCLPLNVSPGQKCHGLMLPYTPLHHLLLRKCRMPLVMTSGNRSDEPICITDDDAVKSLHDFVDYFLTHNRPIHVRCDDSVVRVFNQKPFVLRRSRGYVPKPIKLGIDAPQVLACGADMKNAFCVTKGRRAFLSHYIGELSSPQSAKALDEGVQHFLRVFDVSPVCVAHDAHPDYLSTRYALCFPTDQKVAVQHHHAHIASCLAEQKLDETVIGVAFDGTGYGTDGAVWGGEFFVCDLCQFDRAAHLSYVPLPGGDAAVKEPWRMAVAYLWALLGDDVSTSQLVPEHIRRKPLEFVVQAMRKGVNAPMTSSMGRLFDAVSAILGICENASYDGEAAVLLEMAASSRARSEYPFGLDEDCWPMKIDVRPTIDALLHDKAQGLPIGELAGRFHNTIAAVVQKVCRLLRQKTRIEKVALSGGVFQNCLLLGKITESLRSRGFTVLSHSRVPSNDGGIAIGQAVIAARRTTLEQAKR